MRLCWLALLLCFSCHSYVVFVSTTGNDSWNGTSNFPLKTLPGARSLVARIKPTTKEPIQVQFATGYYPFTSTTVLDSSDSGSSAYPITYEAAQNAEVHFVGGVNFLLSDFDLVTPANPQYNRLNPLARGKVRVMDLAKKGIDPGTLHIRGFGVGNNYPSALEVFQGDKSFVLARYPNPPPSITLKEGWLKTGPGSGAKGNSQVVFNFTNKAWEMETEPWAMGYWEWDWAELYTPISIDFSQNQFKISPPPFGVGAGKNFYFFNFISELDIEGEYYVDRANHLLFIFPFSKMDPSIPIQFSMINEHVVLNNVNYVTFKNIYFEVCRGEGVALNNCNNVALDYVQVKNTGQSAISINGGTSCVVSNSRVYNNGDGGIATSGGNRNTLSPSLHSVVNNDITNFNRWRRTYAPGVSVNGVEVTVQNNNIYNAPHVLILWGGNNHFFNLNRLENAVLESVDAGAVYSGRDWTMRGNRITNNFFSGIPESAIYFDDQFSTAITESNTFVNVHRGILLGGGRDHLVQNNLFVNCSENVYIDGRGLGACGPSDNNATLFERLLAMPYTSPPWSTQYPKLATILDGNPNQPAGDELVNNVYYGGVTDLCPPSVVAPFVKEVNTMPFPYESSDFVNAAKMDFRLVPNHPALKRGFKNVPDITAIGVQGSVGPHL